MRYKKLKVSIVLLLGLGLTGLHAQTMYVKQTNGTQSAYALSDIKKMSFSSGNITVSKTTGSPDTYSLSYIRYLNFQDLTTNIAMIEKQEATIQLYPNPVNDFLNIQVPIMSNQACVIEILSIEGRVVYQGKLNQQSDVYQINVSILPQGMYFCEISNGITTETTKFIKQ
jgi:acid phosphatase type 7